MDSILASGDADNRNSTTALVVAEAHSSGDLYRPAERQTELCIQGDVETESLRFDYLLEGRTHSLTLRRDLNGRGQRGCYATRIRFPGHKRRVQISLRVHSTAHLRQSGELLVRMWSEGRTAEQIRVALGNLGAPAPDEQAAADYLRQFAADVPRCCDLFEHIEHFEARPGRPAVAIEQKSATKTALRHFADNALARAVGLIAKFTGTFNFSGALLDLMPLAEVVSQVNVNSTVSRARDGGSAREAQAARQWFSAMGWMWSPEFLRHCRRQPNGKSVAELLGVRPELAKARARRLAQFKVPTKSGFSQIDTLLDETGKGADCETAVVLLAAYYLALSPGELCAQSAEGWNKFFAGLPVQMAETLPANLRTWLNRSNVIPGAWSGAKRRAVSQRAAAALRALDLGVKWEARPIVALVNCGRIRLHALLPGNAWLEAVRTSSPDYLYSRLALQDGAESPMLAQWEHARLQLGTTLSKP